MLGAGKPLAQAAQFKPVLSTSKCTEWVLAEVQAAAAADGAPLGLAMTSSLVPTGRPKRDRHQQARSRAAVGQLDAGPDPVADGAHDR